MIDLEASIKQYASQSFTVKNAPAESNQFINEVKVISPSSDPSKEVYVSLNESGNVSLVDSNFIQFKAANEAEGYDEQCLIKLVSALLDEKYSIKKRILGSDVAVFTIDSEQFIGKISKR